ncbi:ornithine cyclodeaminase family protein [Fodinicurvata sp. EGI_FJ10296]|uniref:ornithine cyclodeaminase family protein n=1 Tax=Fodinicurvata sp. EGI_FJ10296 TaxID=3231908 RepID=UPI0034541764
MIVVDAETVKSALPWRPLVESLRAMFATGCTSPVRHHHEVGVPGEPDATLLLMPAWREGELLGVKVAQVCPGNGDRGLPAVSASYLLNDARTGRPLAVLDGGELTVRRTAAASALAADYLARRDARTLLVVGTGRLAPCLAAAHCSVRQYDRILVWGRRPEKVAEIVSELRGSDAEGVAGLEIGPVDTIEEGCAVADVISVATLSSEPLINGRWLRPGTHLDLVGAFKPTMRESDDECMRRARVYVDTLAGATKEAGDIVQAIQAGALTSGDIVADLFDLAGGRAAGRSDNGEITLFKSVGASLEDLAAAGLVWQSVRSS